MKALKGIVLAEVALGLLPFAIPVALALVLVLAVGAYMLVTPLYVAFVLYVIYRLVKRFGKGRR